MELRASQDVNFILTAQKSRFSYNKRQDAWNFRLRGVDDITWFSGVKFDSGSLNRKEFVASWNRLIGETGLPFLLESGRKDRESSASSVRLSLPRLRRKGIVFTGKFYRNPAESEIKKEAKYLARVDNPRLQFAGTLMKVVYRKNLRTGNFKGQDLTSSDWTGVIFKRSNFSKSNMNLISAISSDLSWSDFRKASINRADLTGSDLSRSSFAKSSVSDSLLDGTALAGSNFSYSSVARSSFIGADLNKANFTAADMTGIKAIGASFVDADLRGANLTGSDLRFANFSNANLNNVTFADVDFEGANFSGASFIGASCFNEEKMTAQPCPF